MVTEVLGGIPQGSVLGPYTICVVLHLFPNNKHVLDIRNDGTTNCVKKYPKNYDYD